MPADITIKTPSDVEIIGSHPLVIIGPNGSGKSTFGAQLANKNNAELISATRNLQLPDDIPLGKLKDFEQQVTNDKKQQINNISALANDINGLLAKIKAEDAESAVNYRNKSIDSPGDKPELTKIIQLTNLWNSIFPKRVIDFTSHSPKVTSTHRATRDPFGISKMSGGERVALYLLARILDAKPGIIIIDEPEIHFHSVLAKKFWNEVEIVRNDCRFVYITHDLPFAVSRNSVQFIIVFSETDQQILPIKTSIPDEVVETVLGAATFSISAKKIIFCEGSKYNKRDDEFYSAWLGGEEIAIVPVKSCTDVIKSVKVFNNTDAIKGVQAFGIIDRDFRADNFVSKPPKNVKVLDVHELESLFCVKEVFIAIAKNLKISKKDREERYSEFIKDVKNHFRTKEKEKNLVILERIKNLTNHQLDKSVGKIKSKENIDDIKKEYLDSLKISKWDLSPSKIFSQEKKIVEGALKESADIKTFFKLFPGKTLFGKAVQKLGIKKDVCIKLILESLNSDENDKKNPLRILKQELFRGLKKYKPF